MEEKEKQVDTTAETETKETEDNGLPKTQEELDALIEKRLVRERKKFAKANEKPAAAATAAATETPAAPATPDNSAELASVTQQLMLSKAQVAAIKAGVAPNQVEDAVYLAMKEATKDGEADEEDIAEALKAVLKRHPEWKNGSEKSGIVIGAEGAKKKENAEHALPTGRVIF